MTKAKEFGTRTWTTNQESCFWPVKTGPAGYTSDTLIPAIHGKLERSSEGSSRSSARPQKDVSPSSFKVTISTHKPISYFKYILETHKF